MRDLVKIEEKFKDVLFALVLRAYAIKSRFCIAFFEAHDVERPFLSNVARVSFF